MTHDDVIHEMRVARAERRADLGPVAHPRQHIIDAHGVRVYPGQKMWDSVSGQIVEVHHAGIANHVVEETGG